ncbi:MAG: hypothetical protein GTO04_10385, partial [Planctomycetales bacterium]|nr:hypothetical protein [Planctomycetales bacterium]
LAFKPHLAVFIAVAMLFKGQWRFVAGVAATVGIAIVVSLWLGSETCLAYVGVCLTATDYVQAGGYQLSSAHGFWGAASLLLAGDWPWLAKGLAVSLTLLCIALVVR